MKFDGEICSGVLVENASDDFPQQEKLENLLPNFAGSSPPISPKTSPTSLWKSLVPKCWEVCRRIVDESQNTIKIFGLHIKFLEGIFLCNLGLVFCLRFSQTIA